MTDSEILNIYMLQSTNVRHLWEVKDGIVKDINYNIRKSDYFLLKIKTKLLMIIYSAWSEAQFVQIYYTPNGFLYSEIVKIRKAKNENGIAAGWKYMLDEAMKKVGDVNINKDLKKRLDALLSLVSKYIEEPSLLRNKLAHGQWINALNRENTEKNENISNELDSIDPVEIEKRFEIHRFLGYIVRDLIQSPKNGFHKYYWTNIVNLENYIKLTENWSITSKTAKLKIKPIKIH